MNASNNWVSKFRGFKVRHEKMKRLHLERLCEQQKALGWSASTSTGLVSLTMTC